MLFDTNFEALTRNNPFPWQRALYERFISDDTDRRFPAVCDLPTGLGKTSIIALWLLALTHHAQNGTLQGFPRRLVYVVNRRTVVDQSTREAEQLRDALLHNARLVGIADTLRTLSVQPADHRGPLAISTLRGQFADNAEWRDDPARPAVVVGTIDMIGSRLLFSGYGRGFKSRPLHAAFLGQDALLVHDEAHLEPAFQQLVEQVATEQAICGDRKCLKVMALSATSRSSEHAFGLTGDDYNHPVVKARIHASKWLEFRPVEDRKKIADEVASTVLRDELKQSGGAILVFLRTVEDVTKVAERVHREVGGDQVRTLTGTLRGHERDGLASGDPVFARFVPTSAPSLEVRRGTVYLVCTSAGEVGVNISADHLVCDLTPFDSMAQRFGRVNRFGRGNALIDVVVAEARDSPPDALQTARELTRAILSSLPTREKDRRHDASPAALVALPGEGRFRAFTPSPGILPVTDILLDAWSLTTIRGPLPGRPPVTDWLHGIAEWEPPETHVAWREEVGLTARGLLGRYCPQDLLEDYPLKPHELLRDRSARILSELKKICERSPDALVWIVNESGAVAVASLGAIAAGTESIEGRTVILPPNVGGLREGLLNGSAGPEEGAVLDIADLWLDSGGAAYRRRIWDDGPRPTGMRLVRSLDLVPPELHSDLEVEDAAETEDLDKLVQRTWRWYVAVSAADDDGSRFARNEQVLSEHLALTGQFASYLAAQLLEEPERSCVVRGAKWHDLGKARRIWQRSIGNSDVNKVLAKSGPGMRSLDITAYRHEFGTLLDLQGNDEFESMDPQCQDLVLHVIAAHHGRGRPHFPEYEVFDPEHTDSQCVALAQDVVKRFARLQSIYGRWGLAYLESLVRAADVLASRTIEEKRTDPVLPEAAE